MQILKYFLLFLIISNSIFAQYEDDKIIAEVGPIKITVKEFKQRYEMVPHIGRHVKGSEERLKAETLYSIIAEKLWGLKAEEMGFDSSDVMKFTFPNIEKMNVRDALYRKEILNKIKISGETISKAKRRSLYYLNTRFIHSNDKNEIEQINKKIKSGAHFDSLLVRRQEYQLQKDKFYEVHYGQMTEEAEDSLYKLNLYGVSSPIKSPEGWYIFKIYSIENEKIENAKQARNMDKNIKRITEERADQKLYQKFYHSFFPGKKVTTNGEIFWSFSNKVIKILNEKRKTEVKKAGESIALAPEDFMKIKREFGADSLALPFVFLENKEISLQQFLYTFAFEGFYSSFSDPNKIRGQLNSRVKRFIEHELLADKAIKEGLKNLPEVKSEIDIWKSNYLATLYKQTLFDSSNVSDSEVEDYYNKTKLKNSLKTYINIIEIISDNLDEIDNVLKKLDEGAEFSDIARNFYKGKKDKIETGFIPAETKGEVGRIAKNLKVGEVYGPIKVKNSYAIFKLIDKKESEQKISTDFNSIKNEIKKELKSKKLSEKMINNTVKLANEYGVKVDEKLLYNLPVTNYNMMVYRYMGFGGRLLAVPITPTFIEWVEKWQKSKQALP